MRIHGLGARASAAALLALGGGAQAQHIGREATLLTHELMLQAHENLRRRVRREVEESGDAARWWQQAYARSAALFARHVRRVESSVACR